MPLRQQFFFSYMIKENNFDVFSNKKSLENYSRNKSIFSHEKEAFRKHIDGDGGLILDIGCGGGRTSHWLDHNGFEVIGVDISKPLIEAAKDSFPRIEFLLGNAVSLPIKSAYFDYIIFSFNGIDYIVPEKNRKLALQEIHRVLKQEGKFIFSSHNLYYFFPSNLMNPIGYINVLTFWLSNLRKGRLTDPYKIDNYGFGDLETRYIRPSQQKKELKENGFKLCDIFGRHYLTPYTDPWPYYVAKKC